MNGPDWTFIDLNYPVKLHLTYYKDPTGVTVQNEAVAIKPFQIIVWISISTEKFKEWDPRTPKFPALLDIGNNHNFAVSEEHLVKWVGIQPASLRRLRAIREKGKPVPLHAATLWLHTDRDPFELDVHEGIAVYATDAPRLPTLGLRALTNNRLRALVHGDEKRAILRTRPPWYWPF
jgi:hypothetical protein